MYDTGQRCDYHWTYLYLWICQYNTNTSVKRIAQCRLSQMASFALIILYIYYIACSGSFVKLTVMVHFRPLFSSHVCLPSIDYPSS